MKMKPGRFISALAMIDTLFETALSPVRAMNGRVLGYKFNLDLPDVIYTNPGWKRRRIEVLARNLRQRKVRVVGLRRGMTSNNQSACKEKR